MADDTTPVPSNGTSKLRKKKRRKRKRKARMNMNGLERMMRQLESGAMVSTLGAAPAFATAESMITASQAQGQMMLGAVANQQRLNTLGLIATGECVMQMISMGDNLIGRNEYEEDDDEDGVTNDLMARMMNPPVQ